MCSYRTLKLGTVTINNPLQYIDPSGEEWVPTGDSSNPYSWVDSCDGVEGDCHVTVSAAVGDSLRVYGSQNAEDITNFAPNENSYLDLNLLAQHPDANFEVQPGLSDSFLNLEDSAALYNFTGKYGE